MFYMIDGGQAEDDGSAWEYKAIGTGYSRVQVRELSLTLLRDGLRALSAGTDVIVDADLAGEVENLVPGLRRLWRRVHIRGPQPEMAPHPDMIQLVPVATVRLAGASIERDRDGRVLSLKTPFVLDAGSRVPEPCICKIEDNQLTIVSQTVKDLLLLCEPRLSLKPIRYDDEAPPVDVPAVPFRMPSAEELMKGKRR